MIVDPLPATTPARSSPASRSAHIAHARKMFRLHQELARGHYRHYRRMQAFQR